MILPKMKFFKTLRGHPGAHWHNFKLIQNERFLVGPFPYFITSNTYTVQRLHADLNVLKSRGLRGCGDA